MAIHGKFEIAPSGAAGLSSAGVSRLGPGAVLSARSPGYQVGEFSLRQSDRACRLLILSK
jgi:hypothetical protein